MNHVRTILAEAQAFRQEAHSILGVHETSKSRVILLEETYGTLTGLSLKQDELFRHALRCVENGLFRAAHVMAWCGFVDFFQGQLASDGFKTLRTVRPKWQVQSLEDLREQCTEYACIEAGRDTGLCTKGEMKALMGLLNKRNECAHPSDYFPGLNEALGYISELFQRIEVLQSR